MKREIIAFLTVMVLVAGQVSFAKVVGQDNFDTQSLGSDLHTVPPQVGYTWIDYIQVWELGWTSGVVSNEMALSGSQSIKLFRDFAPDTSPRYPYLTLLGNQSTADVAKYDGDMFIFNVAWYGARAWYDRPSIMFDFGSPEGIGGAVVDIYDEITLYDGSGYLSTGVSAQFGQWHEFEFVFYPGSDSTSHTYDAYVSIGGGPKILLGTGVSTGEKVFDEYSNARMTLLMDAPADGESAVSCYYDDLLIQKVAPAVCGDETHPYPVGDFNEDCLVDLADFALLAQNWMTCTDIDCSDMP